jgi:N-acetylglucosaminyldiphosphoundecaprenol N-acetyl-beta-D-mannosaminyltransferase
MSTVSRRRTHKRESHKHVHWPRQFDVFGVRLSEVTPPQAAEVVIAAAQRGDSAVVSCHAVHALITTSDEPELRRMARSFEMITPDGQPVRWAMNLLHGTRLKEPVTGRSLTHAVCTLAADKGVPIYLYGSTPQVIEALEVNLVEQYPGLIVAGAESPPFRPLTSEEDDELVRRVNSSGAKIMLIGLGFPKQDRFAGEHRDRLQVVQLCVGAVFDFYAGNKRTAPRWMQRWGLEWVFRLIEEPRRLWRRYLSTNSTYLMKLGRAWLFRKRLTELSDAEVETQS